MQQICFLIFDVNAISQDQICTCVLVLFASLRFMTVSVLFCADSIDNKTYLRIKQY